MIRIHGGFEIDDSRERIDFAQVHAWLTRTYWSEGIAREKVEKGARHSALVVGAYQNGAQVGYLRVISDTTRFAYLCDVYVDEAHRGGGVGRAMVQFALDHPELQGISRWLLATRDAHGVYAGVGFTPLPEPGRWMVLHPDQTPVQDE